MLPLLVVNFLSAQTVSTLILDNTRTFEAIHWHADGRILVADFNNGRIYQAFTDGTIQTLLTGIPNIAGGGFGSDSHFYFSGLATGQVFRLNADNTSTLIAGGFNQPTGILQSSAADTLLVAQYGNNAVAKLSLSGKTLTPWISGKGISGPDGIINGNNGEIIIANFNDQNVHKVDTAGNITRFASLPVAGFAGYITKVGTNFYIPTIAGRGIYKIDAAGNVTILAGNGNAGNADGVGTAATFSAPNGITSSPTGDTLLITDGSRIRMITNLETTTSVREIELMTNLTISPNPTADLLNISFDVETADKFSWRIFNQQGQLLLQDSSQVYPTGTHQLQIPVRSLALGTYTLQFLDEKGQVEQHLFIKAK